ncbi:hypothetical protein HJG60_011112 [Phyllostomus discolor]|uniref:Uncharacterized protein n=1 Tax=Phyllostomus discolor TaxID=89673 RepID=A0A834A3E7_9CHIR|nr:hypothetical protein HJG60_011112 [Phyllostomus discolor]
MACNPGMHSDWESNLRHFGSQENTHSFNVQKHSSVRSEDFSEGRSKQCWEELTPTTSGMSLLGKGPVSILLGLWTQKERCWRMLHSFSTQGAPGSLPSFLPHSPPTLGYPGSQQAQLCDKHHMIERCQQQTQEGLPRIRNTVLFTVCFYMPHTYFLKKQIL